MEQLYVREQVLDFNFINNRIYYDPKDGSLLWRPTKSPSWNTKYAHRDCVIRSVKDKYFIKFGSLCISSLEVAWILYYKEYQGAVEPIDGNPDNLAIDNLILSENIRNAYTDGVVALTQKFLKESIEYDESTGIVTWKERPRYHFKNFSTYLCWNSKFKGKQIGNKNNKDIYINFTLFNKRTRLHRAIFLYKTGKLPEMVDHINGIKTDNRWYNLREVTARENSKNTSIRSNNKSGVIGVHYNKKDKCWVAQIGVDGVGIHLGSFNDLDSAIKARKQAEDKYGFHSNHGRPLR